uniref:Putative cpij013384 histone deacetylase 3 n=1 Tax=Anopheles marajoara TaxID=58244 RepID=A0A2M4C2Q0_9DIPT
MSVETVNRHTTTTHRIIHSHKSHRSTLVEHLAATRTAVACFAETETNATILENRNSNATAAASCEYAETASHELDYYIDPIRADHHHHCHGDPEGPYDLADIKLDALDFSLTKRLLGAVFFLLIIYAWKQYIDDEEESDTIYI